MVKAITLGIRAALFLSEKIYQLPNTESQRILQLLENFQLPLTLPESISTETIIEKLSRDKKFTGGTIKFVLLRKLGEAVVSTAVTNADIREAIEHLRS